MKKLPIHYKLIDGSDRDQAPVLCACQVSGVCSGQHPAPAPGSPDLLELLEARLKVTDSPYMSLSFEFIWRSEDGKLDLEEFSTLLETLSSSSEEDRCIAIRVGTWICINHLFPLLFRDQQLFSLLDRDENGFIDFRDILVFLFSTEVSLSPEDARLRSFRFYDRSVLTWKGFSFPSRHERRWAFVNPCPQTLSPRTPLG